MGHGSGLSWKPLPLSAFEGPYPRPTGPRGLTRNRRVQRPHFSIHCNFLKKTSDEPLPWIFRGHWTGAGEPHCPRGTVSIYCRLPNPRHPS